MQFSNPILWKFRIPYPFAVLSSNNCRQPEIEVDTFIRSPEAALFFLNILNMNMDGLRDKVNFTWILGLLGLRDRLKVNIFRYTLYTRYMTG